MVNVIAPKYLVLVEVDVLHTTVDKKKLEVNLDTYIFKL